jgi:hypothetical protein
MLRGDVRSTLFGQHNGGQRLEGRGALELLFGGADSGAFSALLTYSGTKIQFDAPVEGGATRRDVRVGHALLLSFGCGCELAVRGRQPQARVDHGLEPATVRLCPVQRVVHGGERTPAASSARAAYTRRRT